MLFFVHAMLFLVAVGYLYHFYHSPNWKGRVWSQPAHIPRERRQILEQFHIRQGTANRGGAIRLGIQCSPHFDFSLGHENWFYRLGKVIGVVREFQLDDHTFDERVYIGSDDIYFLSLLKQSERAKEAIQSLLVPYRASARELVKIHCRGGRLWLHCRANGNLASEELRAMLEADALNLLMLREMLAAASISIREPIAKRIRRRATFLTVSASALIVGAAGLWFAYFWDDARLLNLPGLLRQSFLFAVLLWLVLLGLCIGMLVRTARFHTAFLQVAVLGAIGAFGLVSSAYLHINIYYDEQQPIVRCTTVLETRIEGRRRHSYIVVLAGWRTATGKYLPAVTWYEKPDVNHHLITGESVHLMEHSGRLGFMWLDALQIGCPVQ